MSTTILPIPGATSKSRHVTSLAWDPTGMRIAATCSDGSLWVWHVASQKLLFSRTFKGMQLLTVAWDPAGKKLALGSSAGLSVLQAWNGRTLLIHPFRHAVTKVSWSPLGGRFFAVSGNDVTVFEPGFERVEAHPTRVTDAAWRWDGTCIGSICANGMVKVWDTCSKRMLYSLSDIRDPQRLAWDRQDTCLAVGTGEGIIQLHDPDTGTIQCIEILSRHAISTLTWGKPGIVAATSREMAVWDGCARGKVATMETIAPRHGSAAHAPLVNFAPDGELLATGHRGMVCISSLV
jgi:WD40 repeat protein